MNETQEEWFYIHSGERHGPVSFSELKSRYENGFLNENTLVWTAMFGDDWKQIDKVSQMRSSNEPPLVPTSEIPSLWLYSLIAVPVVMAFVEAIILESNPAWTDREGILWFMLFFIPNTIFAIMDQRAVVKSGRKDAVQGLLLWIFIFVPVYIFLRSKRTDQGVWPTFAWVGSVVASVFVIDTLPSSIYLGTGIPKCDSKLTIGAVEDIYPDIPINFTNARVIDITEIEEVGLSDKQVIRECRALVKNSNGVETWINYSIKDDGDEFYVEVRFDGF